MADDKELDLMFQAIGEAISAWQAVEGSLFGIFFHCLGSPNMGAASIAFASVENFRAKQGMTDALVRFRLKNRSDDLQEWDVLNKTTTTLSKTRNVLAHHAVIWLQIGRSKPTPTLMPPAHDLRAIIKHGNSTKAPQLRVKQIRFAADQFRTHGAALHQFLEKTQPPQAKT
jgi:hypothetical protein